MKTSETRYDIIKRIARREFGWKLAKARKPEDDWDIMWTDDVFNAEKLKGMKPY